VAPQPATRAARAATTIATLNIFELLRKFESPGIGDLLKLKHILIKKQGSGASRNCLILQKFGFSQGH